MQEESQIARYYQGDYYGRYHLLQKIVSIGGDLNLFGWRLDEFYQKLGTASVAYEDRDQIKTQRSDLHCELSNPSFKIKITENMSENGRKRDVQFHGICVQGILPELFFGMHHAYLLRMRDFVGQMRNSAKQ